MDLECVFDYDLYIRPTTLSKNTRTNRNLQIIEQRKIARYAQIDPCDIVVTFMISMYAFSEILFESKDKIIGNDVFRFRNLDKPKHYNDSTICNNSV